MANIEDDDDALSQLIKREATRHAAPVGLAERIAAELRAASLATSPAAPPAASDMPAASGKPATTAMPASSATAAARPSRQPRRWRHWLEAALLFGGGAATAAVVLLNVGTFSGLGTGDSTGDEIAAGHVRSLLADHLTDVASTDRHTVKPWFAGKLDFSPPVQDLADQGFPLVGGRLDVIHARPVAALVYRDAKHVINVYVWPATEPAMKTESHHGFNLAAWSQDGMQFWAVSDATPQELQGFEQALRKRLDDAAAPAR